jgi:hypothetical protein
VSNNASETVQKLESVYKRKLNAIGELRQSILQLTFDNALSAETEIAAEKAAA